MIIKVLININICSSNGKYLILIPQELLKIAVLIHETLPLKYTIAFVLMLDSLANESALFT